MPAKGLEPILPRGKRILNLLRQSRYLLALRLLSEATGLTAGAWIGVENLGQCFDKPVAYRAVLGLRGGMDSFFQALGQGNRHHGLPFRPLWNIFRFHNILQCKHLLHNTYAQAKIVLTQCKTAYR